jgi:hypothetical protein
MPDLDCFLTLYKLELPVLTGSGAPGAFDELAVDCPFVFQHRGQFYMMYVGFDNRHAHKPAVIRQAGVLYHF